MASFMERITSTYGFTDNEYNQCSSYQAMWSYMECIISTLDSMDVPFEVSHTINQLDLEVNPVIVTIIISPPPAFFGIPIEFKIEVALINGQYVTWARLYEGGDFNIFTIDTDGYIFYVRYTNETHGDIIPDWRDTEDIDSQTISDNIGYHLFHL